MKKGIIIVLVLGMLAALVFPLFNGGNSAAEDIAEFSFKENLASRYGEIIPIDFELKEPVKSASLIFNDSVLKREYNIEGKQTFRLERILLWVGNEIA